MKKLLLVGIIGLPTLGMSQFTEKLSLQLEYGQQVNQQTHINGTILDTSLFSLGTQNDPRTEGFEQVDAFSVRFNVRPSRLWDMGIVGRWQQESLQHQAYTPYQDEDFDLLFFRVATHRMEFTQLGANGHFFVNQLFNDNSAFEYGAEAELNFTRTEYEYYQNNYELNSGTHFIGQVTQYRGFANSCAGRLGIHASYGFIFRQSRLAIGLNGGYQFGFSQKLSNSGGESFVDITDQQAEVALNGAYASVFLKFSR
ncbi:MAG: hypothetical protein ACFHU9_15625 [Fluviicola sp.]